MKIKKKLILVFMGLASLVALVGYFSTTSLRKIAIDVDQVRNSSILEVESSTELVFDLILLRSLFNEYIHETIKNDPGPANKVKREIEENFMRFEKALASRRRITRTGLALYSEEELEAEQEELIKIEGLEKGYRLYKNNITEVIAVYQAANYLENYSLHENEWNEQGTLLIEKAKLFKEEAQEEITAETTRMAEEAEFSTRFMLLIAGIAFILAILAGVFVARSIVTPILKLKAATQNIALGIMETITNVTTRDEIGDLAVSFNKMTADLEQSRTKIAEYNRTLEQKVDERTQELEDNIQKLKQADEKLVGYASDLKNSNSSLAQFAYIASHDLQEPLRTSSNFAQLLQRQYKGKLDEKADQYLVFIREAGDRMKTLITDLLEFSRIGATKELEKVNTGEVMQEVLADLGAAITEAGADIQSGQLPVISGYRTELKQLFQNLVINAIKFRKPNTHPQIRICGEIKEGSGKFAISDDGIGIERQHSEKIFGVFQRLHNRNEYDGSGIGLANCKKIVEMHKGNIWVESEFGRGTTFYFTIPQNTN